MAAPGAATGRERLPKSANTGRLLEQPLPSGRGSLAVGCNIVVSAVSGENVETPAHGRGSRTPFSSSAFIRPIENHIELARYGTRITANHQESFAVRRNIVVGGLASFKEEVCTVE